MRALARFGVTNPVAVNLLALALIIGGVRYYFSLPREIFPDFSTGQVAITTIYPSATPEDVERLVTIRIENAIDGLDGIDEMTSTSQQGRSLIEVKLEDGVDVDRFLNEARSEIDTIDDLPDEVKTDDPPVVREVRSQFPVVTMALFGAVSEHRLRSVAERIRDDLMAIDGVVTVGVSGLRDPEIWVEIEPRALERYGLTPEDVAQAIGAKSLQAPIAAMPTEEGDLLLRLDAEVQTAEQLLTLPVRTTPDGAVLRLRDLGARVGDRFERARTLGRFNGRSAVTFAITKDSKGDAIEIADEARAYAEALRNDPSLPEGLSIGISTDFSVYIRNRLETMETSAVIGLSIVLIVLCLFLNFRFAAMTVIGLPVAVLGAVMICGFLGISMNMITMFSFIVVLGMLVDDAIVVVENIYRHMEQGKPPREAAIQGISEVSWPVVATISTTICAFLPLLLIGGTMGKFIRVIPIVVSVALLVSLIEALVILPSHLAEFGTPSRGGKGAEGLVFRRVKKAYSSFLVSCLKWRYLTLSVALAVVVMLGTAASIWTKFELFGEFESKVFFVDLETDSKSTLEQTQAIARRFEDEVLKLPDAELTSVTSTAGISFLDANQFVVGSNLAQISVELREGADRERSTMEIMNALREDCAVLGDTVRKVRFRQPDAGPGGPAVQVEVRGPDAISLERIVASVEAYLESLPGVRDLASDLLPGKAEVRVRLREEGRQLGLSEAELARQIRDALEGREATRVRRDRDDVEILVRYPERFQKIRSTLRDFRVKTPAESFVPLDRVAILWETRGPARISRVDRERAVTVTADVDREVGNANEIGEKVEQHFENVGKEFPGHTVRIKGDREELQDSLSDLGPASMFAMFLIYFILGTLFRSYSQPLLVMAIIPFAFSSVVAGFLVTGENLSFLAIIGLVAMCGIVVNDSLVLMDFVNRERRAGKGVQEALVQAGNVRFRAILLTSLTTIGGLSPLAFFASGQAMFLAPMAKAIVYGLASSTILVLILVPVMYAIWEDLRGLCGRARARGAQRNHSA